jgi:hypothetical protein
LVTLIMPLMGAIIKAGDKMAKHMSTSNCVGKDGGSGCGGVPSLLPSPPLPCSPNHCARRCCRCCRHCCYHHRGVIPALPPLPTTTAVSTAPRRNCRRCRCCRQRGGEEHARCNPPSSPPSTHCRCIPKEDHSPR